MLQHVNFALEEGKVTVLLGASGCGKSTLALLAAGIFPENGGVMESGEIRLLGRPLAEYAIPQRTKALTVLFQNPDLQFCMDTLRKELFFCLENLSVSPEEMEARVEKFARLYGVEELLDRKALHPVRGREAEGGPLLSSAFGAPGDDSGRALCQFGPGVRRGAAGASSAVPAGAGGYCGGHRPQIGPLAGFCR